ncbi:copper(I)-binding protein [Streptosporangium becharense]|uniref:Copper(I)-binding protein n=1 Tax=Streptosporangium becharense TaxID=1816182 RepID=A0A7W9MGS3_9ACTN|nr:copper chaperone PCu(A)C [Streptosporangium becharense]MBB2909278.1 copper(I)-binding protein [Streptosporangium becharense]MBB5819703.1 copper(I)-binding protein [Streptosporangium becharense]
MTRNRRHRAIAAAAFLAAAPALAGCGAGFDATTNKPYAPTEALAVNTEQGIKISQAFFLGPDSGAQLAAGGSTPLYLSMVNTNQTPDTLVGLGVDPAVGTAKVSAPVTLPPNQRVATGQPTPGILIEGLKKPLRGGESITVQLQFTNAGVVPLTIPVITRSREFTAYPAAPNATPAPTPTPTPSASTAGEGDHGTEGH